MPVEIREIVIKTEVKSIADNTENKMSKQDINALKARIVRECLSQIKSKLQSNINSR